MKYITSFILLLCLCSCSSEIKYLEGGYPYPKAEEVTDTNFYFYPVRNIFSKLDSLNSATEYLVYYPFNERNISIKPLPNETFRFLYHGLDRKLFVITLSNQEIVIKKGLAGDFYSFDLDKITEVEQEHNLNARRYYTFSDSVFKDKPYRKRYYDSIIKKYPQLLQPQYFINIDLKSITKKYPPYNYTTQKISLTKKQSDSLINLINNSGYWQLPVKYDCVITDTHTPAFSLEANTKTKYNYVMALDCSQDSSKFKTACKVLTRYAGVEKEIFPVYETREVKSQPVYIKDVHLEPLKKKK